MAPKFYKRVSEQSAVLAQPETDEERLEANKALLACPTCAQRAVARCPSMLVLARKLKKVPYASSEHHASPGA